MPFSVRPALLLLATLAACSPPSGTAQTASSPSSSGGVAITTRIDGMLLLTGDAPSRVGAGVTVHPDGSLEGVRLSVGRASAQSDGAGLFALEGVPVGTIALLVEGLGEPQSLDLDVPADGLLLDLAIDADGRVTLAESQTEVWTPGPGDALALAVGWGDAGRVRELLAAGADPDAPNDASQTPLTVAIRFDQPAILPLLLGAGADPNTPEADTQMTPLHVAADVGQAGAVRLLLEAGADPDAVDDIGRTAADVARFNLDMGGERAETYQAILVLLGER